MCSLSHALSNMLGDWSTVTVCVWGKIVTGSMRRLEEKCLFEWVAGFDFFCNVNYLMDKINILCDNQQVLMLYA